MNQRYWLGRPSDPSGSCAPAGRSPRGPVVALVETRKEPPPDDPPHHPHAQPRHRLHRPDARRGVDRRQLIAADSDILYLDHAVKFFQLLGGDVAGDMVGLPKSQLFIVPGATHVTMVTDKSPLLGGAVVDFLDAKKN